MRYIYAESNRSFQRRRTIRYVILEIAAALISFFVFISTAHAAQCMTEYVDMKLGGVGTVITVPTQDPGWLYVQGMIPNQQQMADLTAFGCPPLTSDNCGGTYMQTADMTQPDWSPCRPHDKGRTEKIAAAVYRATCTPGNHGGSCDLPMGISNGVNP